MNANFNSNERILLWTVAVISFFTINLVFLYALFFEPYHIINAIENPVSAAFIGEAFLMMGLLSFLLTKWRVSHLHWRWFVLLSLAGSLGFALPVAVLWPYGRTKSS